MHIIDGELSRAPKDFEVREWRARVLLWSGRLDDAEREYRDIIAAAAPDADNWMGLASVYSRQGHPSEADKALLRAIEIDSTRADVHAARGRALRDMYQFADAKSEFQKALALDRGNAEARAGLFTVRGEPKHELRLGFDTDLFSFADANQDGGFSLTSQWTPRWKTNVTASTYQRAGTDAEKFTGSVGANIPRWGGLTIGGASSHDNGVIPSKEAFFDFDHGWKLQTEWVRGLESDYGQHWYWYRSAGILTLNETIVLYLPREWTWSLALTGARSHFSGTGSEWRPSGSTRINFPIAGNDQRHLGGDLFYAVGTENFSDVTQIGRFSSQTYGGGLRFQLTPREDVRGFAAYQKRTQDRTETSFGFSYGIRF